MKIDEEGARAPAGILRLAIHFHPRMSRVDDSPWPGIRDAVLAAVGILPVHETEFFADIVERFHDAA